MSASASGQMAAQQGQNFPRKVLRGDSPMIEPKNFIMQVQFA